jgi:hypothetical protein
MAQSNELFEALLQELLAIKAQYDSKHAFLNQFAAHLGIEMPDLLGAMTSLSPAPMAAPVVPATPRPNGLVQVRTGEFWNKTLAESVKIYLERKGEAAPFPEILDALKRGGFVLRGGEVEEKKLRLNLLKSVNFVLIPENNFGLASQYPRKPGRPWGAAAKIARTKKRRKKRAAKVTDGEKPKRGGPKKTKPILELPPAV